MKTNERFVIWYRLNFTLSQIHPFGYLSNHCEIYAVIKCLIMMLLLNDKPPQFLYMMVQIQLQHT